MARPGTLLVTRPEQRLRLLPTNWYKAFVILLAVVWLTVPINLSDAWLDVLARCGVAAIGAIGLNLLTGYTGQISLAHAFFIAIGAYTAAWLGVRSDLPFLLWLPATFVVGALVGALFGPFALRVRGDYLAILSIGLLYIGQHIFVNWTSFTGGRPGTSTGAPAAIGPLDFADLNLFDQAYSRRQGLFWLVWLVVAIVALLARNIVRTRPGRAMQAVRDRDVAAEVVGVSNARYTISAFALSSGLAAVAGGLYGVVALTVSPADFGGAPGLLLSVQYVAMIIIGGIGTIGGAVAGAVVVVAIPRVIEQISNSVAIPFVGPGEPISLFAFNNMIYGALVIVTLVFEPRGMVAGWERVKAYWRTWPLAD
ncbi:MAG: branched-chain amino acid ABC transporter permease [Acidimicrobiia bacterium]|nr:branched-chain amino acid ABC transporter permease [Acidimicrobiia bacterium]